MKHLRLLAVLCAGIALLALSQSAFAYYHPTVGRWLQRDEGYWDGPNVYQYVGSQPIQVVDPSGMAKYNFAPPRTDKIDDDLLPLKDPTSTPKPGTFFQRKARVLALASLALGFAGPLCFAICAAVCKFTHHVFSDTFRVLLLVLMLLGYSGLTAGFFAITVVLEKSFLSIEQRAAIGRNAFMGIISSLGSLFLAFLAGLSSGG